MIWCTAGQAEAGERKDASPCLCTQRANSMAVSQMEIGPTHQKREGGDRECCWDEGVKVGKSSPSVFAQDSGQLSLRQG